MISKELLNEVVGYEASYIQIVGTKLCFSCNIKGGSNINIYELAHKCKEWAISKGYDVLSGGLEAGLYSCYIDYSNKRYTLQTDTLHCEFADTEPEAIFKACKWILEKKEIN